MQISSVSFNHNADDMVSIYEVADTISCMLDDSCACRITRIDDETASLTLVNNDERVPCKHNNELVGTMLAHLCPTDVQVSLPEFGEYEPLLVRLLMAYDDNWVMPYLADDGTARIVKWARRRYDESKYMFA